MSINIQETFSVRAPLDRVWEYLTDPRQVVACLPGAELISVESPTSFLGRVKVKVGPVVAAYDGKVTMIERDDAAHVVRMVGEGRETSGSGSAKMTMTSTARLTEEGVTEVRVVADLDVVGKLAQYGRGMIESVNKQLFKQFTSCVRSTLEPVASAPQPPGPVPSETQSPAARPVTPPPPRPVRVLPLVFRAIWDWIRGVFRRRRPA